MQWVFGNKHKKKQSAYATEMKRKITKYKDVLEKPS